MAPASTDEFEKALAAAAQATDLVFEQLLPYIGGNRLRAAMRYAVLGPGKRLRPYLVRQSAGLFDVAVASAWRVGAALEALHCYSLVHDDLPAMDNDDVRRGRPTVHKAFDEATAILAGDALLTWAFEVLADPLTHNDAGVRVGLVSALAKAAGESGMVGGQMLDIEAESKNFASFEDIAVMQAAKTGALFRFACEAGAILAGADASALLLYADDIGLAFQIVDDILDIESTAAALGKATQKDSGRGKATFVDLLGMIGARRKVDELAASAIAHVDVYGAKADGLKLAARFVAERKR